MNKVEGGDHPIFGISMMCPILVATIFLLPHWWRVEATLTNRIKTFPLVVGQLWSQYRMARILYLGLLLQDESWIIEKEILEKNIILIGKSICPFC